MTAFHPIDLKFMNDALNLARRGAGRTHPNPMVGCLVLDREGRVVGEGWHKGPGLAHAEVEALEQAGDRARGGTLYVSLEPCSHYGRTPPCADRIIQAGIRRVVAAMQDPNPRVSGKGFEKLSRAGIEVTVGVMQREALLLNRAFVTRMTQGRPYVTLKLAQSLDGKAATHTGESQWITSQNSRSHAHQIRAQVDAIIVGIGTVLADDPLLTARPGHGAHRQPVRVVVDSRARTPLTARCLVEPGGPTWVALTQRAPEKRRKELQEAGAQVWISPGDGERVDLEALLRHLAQHEITHVLVEGGPTLAGAFVDADLVDEVQAYIAPLLIGGRKALPSLGGQGRATLAQAIRLVEPNVETLGPDLLVCGRTPRRFLGDV